MAPHGDTIGRANLDGSQREARASSPAPRLPARSRGRRRPRLLGANQTRGRSAAPASSGTGSNQSFVTGTASPYGVAVDVCPRHAPPETEITKGAPKKTEKTKVKFKFSSSEPDSTFECKLDKKQWEPCASPKTVKRLDEGKHTFQVRAIDTAGNVDPSPAKDKFKVLD